MPEDAPTAELLAAIHEKFDGRLQKEEFEWLTPEVAAIYVSCRRPRRPA